MESTMDRRSFLKGSVLAGAVASTGMLLGGCAPKKESESAVEKTARALAMEGLSIGLALLRRSTKAISPKRWSAMCL